MSPTQATPSPTQPSRSARQSNLALGALTLVFRLLLLGVGGTVAWFVGVAIAQLNPANVTDPPIMERLIQRTEALEDRRQTLWTRFRPASDPRIESAEALEPLDLSDAEQQAAQTELDQLQGELQRLRDRTTLLELELGIAPGVAPVDGRLQQLQQRIDPASVSPSTVAGTAGEGGLLVTLPSDALFEADGQMLSPSARGILDSIARDLQSYPNAILQVSAHTASDEAADAQRVQSFTQASAVAQYLKRRLGSGYTWLTVGYGNTQPLNAEGSTDPSRNRRIEIRITPR